MNIQEYAKMMGLNYKSTRIRKGYYLIAINEVEYIIEYHSEIGEWYYDRAWLAFGRSDDFFMTKDACMRALIDSHYMTYFDVTTVGDSMSRSLVADLTNQVFCAEYHSRFYGAKLIDEWKGLSNCFKTALKK